MLANVRAFYESGNVFETLFAALVAGLALFILAFSIVAQATLYYGMAFPVEAVPLVLVLCILISAIALKGRNFSIRRSTKMLLIAMSVCSLLIYHLIL